MNKEPIEAVAWQFLNYDNKEKQYCDIWIDCSKREYDHILQQISDGKTKRLVRELQVISPNTVTISSDELALLRADAERYRWLRDDAGNEILETLKTKLTDESFNEAIDVAKKGL